MIRLLVIFLLFISKVACYYHHYHHYHQQQLSRLWAKQDKGSSGVLPSSKILSTLSYHGMDKELGSTIISKAEKALKSWSTERTTFLDPLEIKAIIEGFNGLLDVKLSFAGGYSQSVRKLCFIDRNDDYIELDNDNTNDDDDNNTKSLVNLNEYTDNIEQHIAAINIDGNFLFDKATQDDFQTSIMATGVSRYQIGDIILLPQDRGAQVIITADATFNIITSLKQVRSIPVVVSEIELINISKRPAQFKQIVCIEASTRLDAVASAVFGISRSKLVKLVDNNNVMVNWKVNNNSAYPLKIGEEIALKDGGKIFIENIEATAKGRFRIIANRSL